MFISRRLVSTAMVLSLSFASFVVIPVNGEGMNKAVQALQAKRVRIILDELAALRSRINKGEKVTMPKIAVGLANGVQYTGWLVTLAQQGSNAGSILMELPQEGRSATMDVVVFHADSVASIVVYDALQADKSILN